MLLRSMKSIIAQSTLLCGPLQKAQTLFEGSVSFPPGCNSDFDGGLDLWYAGFVYGKESRCCR